MAAMFGMSLSPVNEKGDRHGNGIRQGAQDR
jgi:hypothetical protein